MRDELEVANYDGLVLGGCLLETPEINAHRGGDLGNVRCVGSVRLGFDYIGSCADGLSDVHQREHDVVREPLKPCRAQGSAADVKIVFPCGHSHGLAMSSGGINGEVGIARSEERRVGEEYEMRQWLAEI